MKSSCISDSQIHMFHLLRNIYCKPDLCSQVRRLSHNMNCQLHRNTFRPEHVEPNLYPGREAVPRLRVRPYEISKGVEILEIVISHLFTISMQTSCVHQITWHIHLVTI